MTFFSRHDFNFAHSTSLKTASRKQMGYHGAKNHGSAWEARKKKRKKKERKKKIE